MVFRDHVRRPRACLNYLRAQCQMLPFHVLLFMLPIALPYPPSAATRTGCSDLPSRHPPSLLWPATSGPHPTRVCHRREASLVSLLLHR
jgi:hypothetical protein